MNQQSFTPPGAPIYSSQRLPVKLPDQLIGREPDLEFLHRVLQAGAAVLIFGRAGIGKSVLAAAVADTYTERPGGVLWFDAMDDSLRSLLIRIERAYALAGGGTLMERAAAVRDQLRAHQPLIVLDGRVRMEAAREFVRVCVSDSPIIIVSPELVPGPWTPHEVKALDAEYSRVMLTSLVGAIAEEDNLARLSNAVGGHPLSLMIAAHQVALGVVSVDEFIERMPEMPPGDTNRVMAVLMAAYRLLSTTQQGLLLLLGTTVAEGASEELLAQVAGAPESVVRPALRQLMVRKLVSERSLYGRSIFKTHELVHTFAGSFLSYKGKLDEITDRHLEGLLAYVKRHTASRTMEALAVEVPNYLEVGAFAAQTGRAALLADLIALLEPSSDDDFVIAQGFQPELDWLRQIQADPAAVSAGLLATSEDMAESADIPADESEPVGVPVVPAELDETAVEAVEELEELSATDLDLAALLAADDEVDVEEAPPLPPGPATLPEAVASPEVLPESTPRADQEFDQFVPQTLAPGDTAQTIAGYREALETYRANDDVEDELAALEALAALSLEQADYANVLDYVDQGMALAAQVDDPEREGKLLVVLGDLQAMLGRDEGAETAYREAISAFRPVEAWLEIGRTLDKLGMLYLDQERTQDAVAMWEQTIPIFERERADEDLRAVMERTGDGYADLMEWEKAEACYMWLLDGARLAGDQQAEFDELSRLGYLMEMSGEPEQAVKNYRQALHVAFQLDDEGALGQTYLAISRLLIDDTTQLNRVLQLLEAAEGIMPGDSEVQRLYRRAQTRQGRLTDAGVTLPVLDQSLEDYARLALD